MSTLGREKEELRSMNEQSSAELRKALEVCVCVCMCVHACVQVCVHASLCVCVCMSMHVCVQVCVHASLCVCVCMCVHVCVQVCVHACKSVCVCVSPHVLYCMYVCTHRACKMTRKQSWKHTSSPGTYMYEPQLKDIHAEHSASDTRGKTNQCTEMIQIRLCKCCYRLKPACPLCLDL